ncbi:MAG: MlaE family lipid ABC transporter permease subunit [Myxococcales bacterium]|nr:MlaE family lipid ABC transporter permease subunit [Myxococcales bacterium]
MTAKLTSNTAADTPSIQVEVETADTTTVVHIGGQLTRHTVASVAKLLDRHPKNDGSIRLELGGLTRLDSAGVAFVADLSQSRAGRVTIGKTSEVARASLSLFQVDYFKTKPVPAEKPGFFVRVGDGARNAWGGLVDLLILVADSLALSVRGAPQTAKVRRGAFVREGLRIGVDSLPIVGLISFLVGVVVALQSAYQLRQFGASIFVANLIAVSMAREMGPLMTAIILAGRSGAAIAAEIATMKVSEEIDALQTMGLNPTRYIVVPKLQAITATMPALTVYSVVLGIFGGYLVALLYLDISTTAFFRQVHSSLVAKDIWTGLVKSVSFAWIIVLTASSQGFQAHGGAESVGLVTTRSVVKSIFWVIVADAIFSLLFYFGG